MATIKSIDALEYYEQSIQPSLNKQSSEYINNIIGNSKFDKEAVDKISKSIELQNKQIKIYQDKIINKKGFKAFLWILILAAIACGYFGINYLIKGTLPKDLYFLPYILIPAAVVLLIIPIIFFVLISKGKKKIAPVIESRDRSVKVAKDELRPILQKISKRQCYDIIEKSFPDLKLSESFSNIETNLWKDYLINHDASSVFSEMHGIVYNNPFLFLTTKRIEIIPTVYTGSVTIMVSVRTYNSSTKSYTTTTEPRVVTASITKPKPAYILHSNMWMKSKAFPELEYYNQPSLKSNHQVNNFYKDYKKQRVMENAEFDRLFPCVRNNEIQFRATFQLYAQEQIVNLFKRNWCKDLKVQKQDDVVSVKCGNPLTNLRIDFCGENFLDYSPEMIAKNFVNGMENISGGLYKYFAPIFCVSLYQQEKYMYKNVEAMSKYNQNSTCFNLENFFNCNNFVYSEYLHKNTSNIVYDAIPKFEILSHTKKYTTALMDVFSFKHEPRVEHKTVVAYGRTVVVPIHWNEYSELHNHLLVLSYHTIDKLIDFHLCADTNDSLKKYKILDVFKSLDRVIVVFDPLAKNIRGNEEEIIEQVNDLIETKIHIK